MELLRTEGGQVVEVGAPTQCPNGHQLGAAGTVLVGIDSPDPDLHGRVRTYTCRACWSIWFDGWGWR